MKWMKKNLSQAIFDGKSKANSSGLPASAFASSCQWAWQA